MNIPCSVLKVKTTVLGIPALDQLTTQPLAMLSLAAFNYLN